MGLVAYETRCRECHQFQYARKLSEHADVHGIISEEHDDIQYVGSGSKSKYIVAFDPIDGSNNIEFNITTGTIFAIYHKDIKSGRDLITAGYCLYGGTVEFVYYDVADEAVKAIRRSNDQDLVILNDIRMPERGKTYSINSGNGHKWSQPELRQYIDDLGHQGYGLRYVGSMVADVHRVIMGGGVFMYPADTKNSEGKIRIYYEAYPMAFLVEKVGGCATNYKDHILDIKAPKNVHQRVPFASGSHYEMDYLSDHLG